MHPLSALNLDSLHLVCAVYNIQLWSVLYILSTGSVAVSSGVFGDDVESSVLFSVECSGDERGILSCLISQSGTCTQGHSSAVICQGLHTVLF